LKKEEADDFNAAGLAPLLFKLEMFELKEDEEEGETDDEFETDEEDLRLESLITVLDVALEEVFAFSFI
jgi:hypothetical protein